MSEDMYAKAGVTIIGTVVILREVFNFMSKQKAKNGSTATVARSEFETHKQSVQYKDSCERTHEGVSQRFRDLEKLHNERKEHYDKRFDQVDAGLDELKQMIARL